MKLTLYCFPGACSRATMISLEETGAAYSTHVPNMMKNEQKSPEYLAVNPKGKVPVLVVDGEPLTDNIAILGFLADSFPDSGLLLPITDARSEEHTSELQSLMRISYALFCLYRQKYHISMSPL